MLEPVGPLPAAVYWRRRWTALIATVACVVLTALAVSALGSTNQGADPANDRTAPLAAETALNSTAAGPASATSSTPPTTPPPTTPPPATTTPVQAPEPSEQIRPEAVPTAAAGSGTPGVSATPPPTEIACPDRSLVVSVQSDRTTYRVGEKPVFRLVVTNIGPTPCKRDLDLALQEVFVVANPGAKRTWSSNDCFPGHSTDLRLLAPNTPAVFTVTWSGLGSEVGCKTPRKQAPAGSYAVGARLGAVTTNAPVNFTLTAPQTTG